MSSFRDFSGYQQLAWFGFVSVCKSTAGCRLRVSVLEQKIFSWCVYKALSMMEPLDSATKQGINHSLSQAVVKPALEAVVSEHHCWKKQFCSVSTPGCFFWLHKCFCGCGLGHRSRGTPSLHPLCFFPPFFAPPRLVLAWACLTLDWRGAC